MKERLSVTTMRPEHIQEIYRISCACFTTPWSLESWEEEYASPSALTLVALLNDEVVGYLNVHHVFDEGDLNLLAVQAEYRRKGIAARLVKELEIQAKRLGIRCYTLEVRTGNASAIAFYTRLGFEQVGRRKNYYIKPVEDALLLRKLVS